jgi:hypothetical protein
MIEFLEMIQIADDLNLIREQHPGIAKELDKCLFEILNNHTPKCGHGNCSCETMTFEQFHFERNLKFGTASEARCYEFN